MGSDNNKRQVLLIHALEWLAYLNAGRGVPCAGHVRAIPEPWTLSKADELKMEGN